MKKFNIPRVLPRFNEGLLGQTLESPEVNLQMMNRMLVKKERQGGLVFGYHGTSAKRAREILAHGFKDHTCVEGGFGVHVWDDEFQSNAVFPGKNRAIEEDDSQYAVIRVRCREAAPDLLMGRPQWLALAKNIEILDVQFFDRDS